MSEKIINSRIKHKHATAQEWESSTIIPLAGEVIIYDVDEQCNSPKIKIGDGVTSASNLPVCNITPDELPTYIDNALNDAKDKGTFDGKNAYEYAVDSGFSGSETDFSQKLASYDSNRILDQNSRRHIRFWFGSETEYNSLINIEPDILYCICDGESPLWPSDIKLKTPTIRIEGNNNDQEGMTPAILGSAVLGKTILGVGSLLGKLTTPIIFSEVSE